MSKHYTFTFQALGGPCSLQLYAETAAEAEQAAAAAAAEIDRIEKRYSRYLPHSLLSKINAAARSGATIELDSETTGLLDYAFACHRQSGGLFDITSGLLRKAWKFNRNRVPRRKTLDALLPRIGMEKLRWQSPTLEFTVAGMELDFGGIAKEYAVDRVVDICRQLGVVHGLVELGGDIGIIGPHPAGSPWLIGIRHHRQPDTILITVPLQGGALAVSGDYERSIEKNGRRLSHILNPKTGWPCSGLSSVSIVADRCMVAGSISTIAMLKEKEGSAWLRTLNVPALFTADNDQLQTNQAWEKYFT